MKLRFASYNIRKAVGLDRRRDHERILRILLEMDADVVALQEADRRYGRRMAALPLDAIQSATDYVPVPLSMKPDSLGWHGNALLVRRGIDVVDAAPVPLPVLEPRGAIRADLDAGGQRVRVLGMHLDISGLRRRHQVRTVLDHVQDCGARCPTVMMGDFNEWARRGCFREFDEDWRVLSPGRTFPSRRPMAPLDRMIVSAEWSVLGTSVHKSALSATGSDHLPILAQLGLSE